MTGPRVRAALVLLAVFGLGVFAGMFYERHHARSTAASVSGAEVHAAAMAELREELDLDDEQIEQVHALLRERQEEVQRIWEQLRPEVQSAMRDVHGEIAELLRPEQRQRFHEWLSRQHEQTREALH